MRAHSLSLVSYVQKLFFVGPGYLVSLGVTEGTAVTQVKLSVYLSYY